MFALFGNEAENQKRIELSECATKTNNIQYICLAVCNGTLVCRNYVNDATQFVEREKKLFQAKIYTTKVLSEKTQQDNQQHGQLLNELFTGR